MYIHGACNLGHGNVNSSDAVLTHSSKVVNWSKDQLLPRPDRARISGPEGPEILVHHKNLTLNPLMPKGLTGSCLQIFFTVCAVHHLTLLRINLSSLGHYRVKKVLQCLLRPLEVFEKFTVVGGGLVGWLE